MSTEQTVRTITVLSCPCCGLTVKSYDGDEGWTCKVCSKEMQAVVGVFAVTLPCQHGEVGHYWGLKGEPYPRGGKGQ